MKLLVDMNLTPRWVDLLNGSRFQAVHWASVGNAQAADTEIMSYAAEHEFVVVTNDLDFGATLAATHGEKPSVVQIRSENLDPDFIGLQVINALQQLEGELQAGALVNVEPSRTRIRLLPLQPKDDQ